MSDFDNNVFEYEPLVGRAVFGCGPDGNEWGFVVERERGRGDAVFTMGELSLMLSEVVALARRRDAQ